MARQEFTVVHTIKVIARKDEQRVDAPVPYVRQHLANGIGRALKPLRALGRLFGGEVSQKHRRTTKRWCARWAFSEAELYCVSTKMRITSELMQFEIGMSTSRYLPPSGTAGFERSFVNGNRREPAPPPSITASTLRLDAIASIHL